MPYYSTASANSRIITLYRHAAAALSGLIIGAAMAFYQLLLTDVIDTVWTASALILLTPAWAVLLVPPALLCLAACLMSYLPHGHMALFIKMVTTTTSTAVEMEEEVVYGVGLLALQSSRLLQSLLAGLQDRTGRHSPLEARLALQYTRCLAPPPVTRQWMEAAVSIRHGHRRLSSSSEAIGPRMVVVLSPLRPIMVV